MPVHALEGISPELPPAGRYWIAPTASVIGKVTIGEGVGIWFGVVIRGDQERITVGADTTPPTVVGHADRDPNPAGWYRAPLTLTWSATDAPPSSGTPTTLRSASSIPIIITPP